MKTGLCIILVLLSSASWGEVLVVRHIVAPSYPRLARIAQWQGSVKLEITISKEGKVSAVTATGGHKVLQEAAQENIKKWTFDVPLVPANSSTKYIITYSYRLKGRKEYYDLAPSITFDLPERVEIESYPYAPQP